MRRITLLILSSLITGFCWAQGELSDTFDANNGWSATGGEAVEKFEDGKYIVRNKERYTFIRSEKEVGPISEGADFMVKVKAQLHRISYAGGNNQYGVAMGNSDMSSYYVLAIRKDTTYALAEIVNGDTVTYVHWKKHYIVKPDVRQNTLAIIKENKHVYYQINGYNVYAKEFSGSYANKVALLTGIKSIVAFDSLAAKVTAPLEINVAANAVKKDEFELKNLGCQVNSCFTEILPRLSTDAGKLYMTRMDHPENIGDETNAGDIWVSTANANAAEASEEESEEEKAKWALAQHLGNIVNNDNQCNTNFIISFAPDGSSMYLKGLYGDYHPIYESEKDGDGWGSPKPMKIEDYYNLSSEINICTTSDRKGMIISIERLDSKGGRDLYYSERGEGDSWTKPVNLGDMVNTYGDDISPFLASDDKTLYYATKGKPGYGGFDVFRTVRQGDSWTEWSEPENLGEVINSAQDDRDYYIPENVTEGGPQAFMASAALVEGACGGLDIYELVPVEDEAPARRGLMAGDQIRINFDFDKSDIRPADAENINRAIGLLNKGTFSIEIAGHTDALGGEVYNQRLSERRSESVYNYLTRNGLDTEKIKVKNTGYGKKYPCDTNSTDAGRFNNRRVLVVILGEGVGSYLDVHQQGSCGATSFNVED